MCDVMEEGCMRCFVGLCIVFGEYGGVKWLFVYGGVW